MAFSMKHIWNPAQARMRDYLRKKETFAAGMDECRFLHAMAHVSGALPDTGGQRAVQSTLMDELWEGLDEAALRRQPTPKAWPVAWHVWHITRIEDLIANLLIAEQDPVLDAAWMERVGAGVRDTGNAMTPEEMAAFSSGISLEGLTAYRNAVALRTRAVLDGLTFEDMKRKPSERGLRRIMEEGGLVEHPESFWLLEFWGRKTMIGLLGLPITRHQPMHINAALKLKKKR